MIGFAVVVAVVAFFIWLRRRRSRAIAGGLRSWAGGRARGPRLRGGAMPQAVSVFTVEPPGGRLTNRGESPL